MVDIDPARWATLAAEVKTMVGHPASTLKPSDGPGSYGRTAAKALTDRLASGDARVELKEVIGEGGMGVVHNATQARLHRDVAVKSVRVDRRSDENRAALLREAWMTGALEHPNILPVYGIEADSDGEPLIVLKKLENTRWLDLMHDPEAVAARHGGTDLASWNLQVFMQICRAVHFAHSRRVVHLDLKPENVMIGAFGEVFVVDWGIAMSLEDDGSGRLRLAADNTQILGTPKYLAPEMLCGDGSLLDERTDVFLLGACLYHLTEGTPPHKGETLMEILRAAALDEPEPPRRAHPELARTITRALARSREDRHPSAEELRLEVLAFVDHRDSRTRSDEAHLRLSALEGCLDRIDDEDSAARHREVHRLFSECRFGFQGALGQWPGNVHARDGLDAALKHMARYELGRDDLDSAAAHLDALWEDDVVLRDDIAQRRAELSSARDRAVELEKLGADLDIAVGQRTRAFLFSVLGVLWTVGPLGAHLLFGPPREFRFVIWIGLSHITLATGLGVWARESIMRTAINRRLAASVLGVLLLQLAVVIGGYRFGLTAPQVLPFIMPVWATGCLNVVLFAERRMWPAFVAVLGCFAAAVTYPDLFLPISAVVGFALTLNAVLVWWPWSHAAKRARAKLDGE